LTAPALRPLADTDALAAAARGDGAVFELSSGLPTGRQLEALARVLRAKRRAWLYWPRESAVECVDAERLDSLRRHVRRVAWMRRTALPADRAMTTWRRVAPGLRWIYRGEFPVRRSDILIKLTLLTMRAQPAVLEQLRGPGVYLRTDYWAESVAAGPTPLVVGGLNAAAGPILCLAAPGGSPTSGEAAADRSAGAHVVTLPPPRSRTGEDAIVSSSAHYEPIVRTACAAVGASFLYERLAAGQSAGAEVSQALGIPYICEYAGAGAAVREALGAAAPFYPELYAQAEELSLRQAVVVVVPSEGVMAELVGRGIDASRVLVAAPDERAGGSLAAFIDHRGARASAAASIATGDAYKDQVQNQWNQNPVGSQHARGSQPHTLDWFLEVERHRYETYAPWMPRVMEFADHAGQDVLEVGGGIGTDLAQFARHGARVTDLDLAAGHLQLAEENFRLRGLEGRFIHHDAETLPFGDGAFDLVYSNGVLHHTPNTSAVVREIHRVLRPGGRAIVMLYAEDSLHYWRKQVWQFGVKDGLLDQVSMGEIMSRTVERSANEAKPLVKVYTKARAAALFAGFTSVEILQRQLEPSELPTALRSALPAIERRLGWNLIVKATRPR
jgi:ubiquinone/menaquinone biosynthesis C-methylase UbiE